METNYKDNYYKSAEFSNLQRAIRFLELLIEEYVYKYESKNINRFNIPRKRFEKEDIYLNDIEYCLDKYINSSFDLDKPILTIENNRILNGNIEFGILSDISIAKDRLVKGLFEYNKLKYSEIFEFTIRNEYCFQDLIRIFESLKNKVGESNILSIQNEVALISKNHHSKLSIDMSKGKLFYSSNYFDVNPEKENIKLISILVKNYGKIVTYEDLHFEIGKKENLEEKIENMDFAKDIQATRNSIRKYLLKCPSNLKGNEKKIVVEEIMKSISSIRNIGFKLIETEFI